MVANYYGNKKLYVEVPGRTIHWGGDRTEPPPDVPKCGFDGLGCPKESRWPERGVSNIGIVASNAGNMVLGATGFNKVNKRG